jgi:very-short-patch-repair endonuclease
MRVRYGQPRSFAPRRFLADLALGAARKDFAGALERVGDIELSLGLTDPIKLTERLPFVSWASSVGFTYPSRAARMLARTGSAAEAYFIRELFEYDDTYCDGDGYAHVDDVTVAVQVPCSCYRIDATAEQDGWRLAIEVDGLAFHHRTQEQVAADYARQRRILCAGYIVARFTAKEAIRKPAECWPDVFDILRGWCASPKRVTRLRDCMLRHMGCVPPLARKVERAFALAMARASHVRRTPGPSELLGWPWCVAWHSRMDF